MSFASMRKREIEGKRREGGGSDTNEIILNRYTDRANELNEFIHYQVELSLTFPDYVTCASMKF